MAPSLAVPDVMPSTSMAGPAPLSAEKGPTSLLASSAPPPGEAMSFGKVENVVLQPRVSPVDSSDLVRPGSDFQPISAMSVEKSPSLGAEPLRGVGLGHHGPTLAKTMGADENLAAPGRIGKAPPGATVGPDGYPAGSGFMDRLKFHIMNNPEIVSGAVAMGVRMIANQLGFNMGAGGTVIAGAGTWALMKFAKGVMSNATVQQ